MLEKNSANDLYSQLKIQEKPLSKHANRRKKKKGGQVIAGNPNQQPGGGQHIMNDADPSLDDLR